MDNPIISVIVPVYNVEKYLSRCIDSILSQTFTDFELLLIDDGSKDNSGNICDEYARKDGRIRVFHKVNGGVSSARNLGLENALGEWICFIDSDDEVENYYLSTYIEVIKKDSVDCCIASCKIITSKAIRKIDLQENLYTKKDIYKLIMYLREKSILGVPWNKFFKLSIIKENDILFDESISSYEDEIYVLQYLQYITNIAVSKQQTYRYYINNEISLSKKYIEIDQHFKITDTLYNLGAVFSVKKEYVEHLNNEYSRHLEECIYRLYGKYTKFNRKERLNIITLVYNKSRIKGLYELLVNRLNNQHLYFFNHLFIFDLYCLIIIPLKVFKYSIFISLKNILISIKYKLYKY